MGDRAEEFRSAAVAAKPNMGAGDRVLVEEACRLIDRSDRLDALLSGDIGSWLELQVGEDRVVVVVASPMTEARQTAAEIRQIMSKLDLKPVEGAAPVSGDAAVLSLLDGGMASGKRTG